MPFVSIHTDRFRATGSRVSLAALALLLLVAAQPGHAATAAITAHSVTYRTGFGNYDSISYSISATWSTFGYTESSWCNIHAIYYDANGAEIQEDIATVASQGAYSSPVTLDINPTFDGWSFIIANAPTGARSGKYWYAYHVEVEDWNHNTVVSDYKDESNNPSITFTFS